MHGRYLLFALAFLFIIPIISGESGTQQSLGTFKLNECIQLKQICANCTFVNITSVTAPNSTQLLGEVAMQKQSTEYNYTFCSTSALGEYLVQGKGNDNGPISIWTYDFEVTPLGNKQTSAQGIGGLGVIAIFIFLTCVWGVFTYAFARSQNFKPLALLAFGLMVIFMLIDLHLSYIYTRDVAVLENTANTVQTVYTSMMYLMIVILLISMVFLLVYVIKQWKAEKKIINSDDGWDNGLYG